MSPIFHRSIAVATWCLLPLSLIQATPANKKALEKFFGTHLPTELSSCAACHQKADGHGATSLEDFPHNAFGKSLAALDGKIADRIETLLDGDADKDGVSNLHEILTGNSPGLALAKESSPDLAGLDQKLKAFATFQSRYRWKPFTVVTRPALPEVKNKNWIRNPIDSFISAQHEARGLQPRPEAARETWLRRVSIDLTGLAPTPREIQDFLDDDSDHAFETVVDRLLASPRHGERWGRHWMDVWRYSDWAGYKAALRESARHIWNWRDWIVESINGDLGYNEMVREMLAADELYPGDEEKLRATGYLARNFHTNRDQWMDDVVTHTSQAFLGITMGCSKCHDHMYDPFPQGDYYAMRAIFEPYRVRTDRIPGELDIMKNGLPRAYDSSIEAKTYFLEGGDERFPVKDKPIPPGIPASLGGDLQITKIKLPVEGYRPWRRDFVRKDLLAVEEKLVAETTTQLKELPSDADQKTREELELKLEAAKLKQASLLTTFAAEALEDADKKNTPEWKAAAEKTFDAQRKAALAAAKWQLIAGENSQAKAEQSMASAKAKKDKSKEAAATRAMTKAKKDVATARKSLAAAEKQMQAKMTTAFKARQGNYPNQSSGRRTAFANWLVESRNPLTARVAMNQIWMRHFEHGIVPTVNEFGGNGQDPTHPALLDWLAAEFMSRDWSMKAMHKLIVLSSTYRQCGTPDPANLAIDPDNKYLWRMPGRRMEGEIVRDNLLWVSGRLDETMGGPDIDHTEAQDSVRRSIYFRHAHEKLVNFVQIFDGPKVTECYLRHESVQPHQALAMHNSTLTKKAAEKLAEELADSQNLIEDAFIRILGRRPNIEEEKACSEFLGSAGPEEQRTRQRFMTVLLNHNDFVVVR